MIKKIIVLFVASVFLSVINYAQDNPTDLREKLMFGLKAGVNISNVYDTKGEEFNADPKPGLAAGLFLTIPIGKYLGVQPEVLFSQKGFQATGKILGNNYGLTRTSNFIDLPILFQLKPASFLTLMAGPQYSYLISQRDVFTDGNSSVEQEQEFKNDNLRKNIFCFLGGLDINLNHVVLGARVGWDITKNNGDGTSATPRYKNVWYQATFGLRF
jgi:hypothetical protein